MSRHDRLLVGDSIWVDLVQEGFPANQVVWYSKLGTDPAVDRRFPKRWHDFQYLVWSGSLRASAATAGYHRLHTARADSTAVASWGTGATKVTIYRIRPSR